MEELNPFVDEEDRIDLDEVDKTTDPSKPDIDDFPLTLSGKIRGRRRNWFASFRPVVRELYREIQRGLPDGWIQLGIEFGELCIVPQNYDWQRGDPNRRTLQRSDRLDYPAPPGWRYGVNAAYHIVVVPHLLRIVPQGWLENPAPSAGDPTWNAEFYHVWGLPWHFRILHPPPKGWQYAVNRYYDLSIIPEALFISYEYNTELKAEDRYEFPPPPNWDYFYVPTGVVLVLPDPLNPYRLAFPPGILRHPESTIRVNKEPTVVPSLRSYQDTIIQVMPEPDMAQSSSSGSGLRSHIEVIEGLGTTIPPPVSLMPRPRGLLAEVRRPTVRPPLRCRMPASVLMTSARAFNPPLYPDEPGTPLPHTPLAITGRFAYIDPMVAVRFRRVADEWEGARIVRDYALTPPHPAVEDPSAPRELFGSVPYPWPWRPRVAQLLYHMYYVRLELRAPLLEHPYLSDETALGPHLIRSREGIPLSNLDWLVRVDFAHFDPVLSLVRLEQASASAGIIPGPITSLIFTTHALWALLWDRMVLGFPELPMGPIGPPSSGWNDTPPLGVLFGPTGAYWTFSEAVRLLVPALGDFGNRMSLTDGQWPLVGYSERDWWTALNMAHNLGILPFQVHGQQYTPLVVSYSTELATCEYLERTLIDMGILPENSRIRHWYWADDNWERTVGTLKGEVILLAERWGVTIPEGLGDEERRVLWQPSLQPLPTPRHKGYFSHVKYTPATVHRPAPSIVRTPYSFPRCHFLNQPDSDVVWDDPGCGNCGNSLPPPPADIDDRCPFCAHFVDRSPLE